MPLQIPAFGGDFLPLPLLCTRSKKSRKSALRMVIDEEQRDGKL